MAITIALLVASLLLLVSVLASKASARYGVPALLIFIAIGMLAGSEGPGGIYFDDVALAQAVGVVALAFILFSGGLDTAWSDVRPVLSQALSLATVGVVVSAAIVGLFVHLVLGFKLVEGFLVGAIVSSTDAAAVFSVLRARALRLRGTLRPLVELESGSNDPMAVFLTIALIEKFQHPDVGVISFAGRLVLEMAIGAGAGVLIGRLALTVLNRIRLEHDGLYPVMTIAIVLLTYAATTAIHGNGFLAVYAAGTVIGNRRFIHRASLIRFHDGLAWLMQIAMFLTLGLLVFPSQLVPVAAKGVLIALVLTLFARPVSVFVALMFSRLGAREKLLVSWMGLRGAVPIVLATFPLMAHLPEGGVIFNLVFFVVLVSVVLQGPTIPWAARVLGLTEPPAIPSFESGLPRRKDSELITVDLPAGAPAIGAQIVDLGLPEDATVLLIHREGGFFPPTGATIVEPGDKLMLLTSRGAVATVRELLRGPERG